MQSLLRCIGGAALFVLLACVAWAQPGGKPVPPVKTPEPVKAPEPVKKNGDPTKPSPKLQEALDASKGGPNATAPRLPVIHLKGRVIGKDKPPAALLELDPKQPAALVTKGTTLSLGGNLKLTVVEVSATEVRIEISPLNETIVLR